MFQSQFGAFGASMGGQKRKPPVSKAEHRRVLASHRFIRQENARLSAALRKNDGQQARIVFLKLARTRDALRLKATRAQVQRERAHLLQKAHAADVVLRYWRAELHKQKQRMHALWIPVLTLTDALEPDGASTAITVAAGEEQPLTGEETAATVAETAVAGLAGFLAGVFL